MPRIFDNIDSPLLPALKETLKYSHRADFCVGYFNLRGWQLIDDLVDPWKGGEGNCCRLLVGMQQLASDHLALCLSLLGEQNQIDNATAIGIKRKLVQDFRDQLTFGTPSESDEKGLRRLAQHITENKLVVKLFLRHPLHAKLYLNFRLDHASPTIGYLGSSNLTLPGLASQGELNTDVVDNNACEKLEKWFEDRWDDKFCLDISKELVEIINNSWARLDQIPPYHIYIKMAYLLSQEARAGLNEFRIPSDFGNSLFEFQKAAVKIAAHHLNKRGGVIIGDVVGLGKTLMATALARIFEDDQGIETLIICPKNLVPMWEDYRQQYRLRAKVISITNVHNELGSLRRFRLVLIDESHNLRNRNGTRYRAIAEYIKGNDCRVILLSATPYNKSFLDLSNQIRLFVEENADIGVRPEQLLKELGETEFIRRHQCPIKSLAAFEKSEYVDDWRDLMRLYLVRRTRSFIQENYAKTDPKNGRKYLEFENGGRSYFPARVPKTIKFLVNSDDPKDQYASLFSRDVLDSINQLKLPRYGLGNYLKSAPNDPPSQDDAKIMGDLSRAGTHLKGFCRTGLFKRLESSGNSFLLSVQRHILRNYIFIHALENNLPIPIGTQDVGLLDTWTQDVETDMWSAAIENNDDVDPVDQIDPVFDDSVFKSRAKDIYSIYSGQFKKRFRWLRPTLFIEALKMDLISDSNLMIERLKVAGNWNPDTDQKLSALVELISTKHLGKKILVFTQFADTVHYLESQLSKRTLAPIAGVTGNSENPSAIAQRFSPISNNKRDKISPSEEIQVVIATDVLSEGQNLQDCSIIINYDLPWAIIRLIQRAGRVDRIGQQSDKIICYSFLPAEKVEEVINLRKRILNRLSQNAEVVGTDESFFDDDAQSQPLRDLYNENAGILDGDNDSEVDLASFAYQIWKNAIDKNPGLEKIIRDLPDMVYSAKAHTPSVGKPEGALVYLKTSEGNDALAWVSPDGKSVSESQMTILKAAACNPDTPAVDRLENHHALVASGVKFIVETEKSVGGQLGRPSGARFRTYERLKSFVDQVKGTLFDHPDLRKAIEEIYKFPLQQSATDIINRQLKSGIDDQILAHLVLSLRQEVRLCQVSIDQEAVEPKVICSLGLKKQ